MNTGLHVQTLGHGPDLVLLHGWGLHGGVFAPLVERLVDDFTPHVVDLPGHGLSRGSAVPLAIGPGTRPSPDRCRKARSGSAGRSAACSPCKRP
jgi:pimeloyl-ACP methyl ester carboxylesterase